MKRPSAPDIIQLIAPDRAPWHILTGLAALVVVVYFSVLSDKVGLGWLPVGLFALWVVVGFFLPARFEGKSRRWTGILYFLTGIVFYHFILRASPIGYVLLFVLYPTTFNRLELPAAIVTALLIGGATVLAEFMTPGFYWWSPGVLLGGIFGSVGAILLGVFIERLASINEELQSTRDELAQAEREAGMLEERQRLAREIHDTLAQGFTSITMHLEAAEGALGGQSLPEATQRHINLARQTARDSLTEARRMVRALRPDLLENASSLDEAIQRYAERWSSSSGVAVTITVTGERLPLPVEHETALLRSAQEALNNVQKHAAASKVTITLSYMGDETALDIYDDGRGFDPARVSTGADSGFGLRGMRERIEALGGEFCIESEPDDGTTIALSLPLAVNEET